MPGSTTIFFVFVFKPSFRSLHSSRSLAAVYLVGGSVSFPPVARKLREAYPSKVKVSPFPHASTAIGLSIAGDPNANIKVRESVSRHFGIWRERGKDKIFDPIFL
jgi:molecular chaperone DnaK (HSP70)